MQPKPLADADRSFLKRGAANASNPDLKALAAKALPRLRAQLDSARRLSGQDRSGAKG
jgi:hypothetical protein